MLLSVAVILISCGHKTKTEGEYKIVYSVQNSDTYAGSMSAPQSIYVNEDNDIDQVLDKFCDYLEAGNTVTFYNDQSALFKNKNPFTLKSKTTDSDRTITTASRDEFKTWCSRMESQGLTVVIEYDKTNGMWRGYAYALPPSQLNQTKCFISHIEYRHNDGRHCDGPSVHHSRRLGPFRVMC